MAIKKTTELDLDETNPLISEEFVMNTDLGTVRVPRYAIPGLADLLVFVTPDDSSLRLTVDDHEHRFLNLNNSTADIEILVPDVDDINPNIDGNDARFGGAFCDFVVGSNLFDVFFTSDVAGDLRGVGPNGQLIEADTIYAGLSRDLSDEALIRIYKRGGLWVAWCSAGWRENADDNDDRKLTATAEQNRTLTDDDHNIPVWLTDSAPGTLEFQTDIKTGTVITVINQGAVSVPIDFGSHTQVGDATIAAAQAATIIVGPVVSGDNKEIFVAASS